MKLLKSYEVSDLSDLAIPARDLISLIKAGDRIQLVGDLGAGKTTFVRQILREFGYSDPVPSPTYPLLIEYEVNGHRIIHIDGFRLDGRSKDPWDTSEWKDAFVFVEWAEKTQLPLASFRFQVALKSADSRRDLAIYGREI
jgi:tRNA threonylcarbamoyladenosine biosynthesis protein TsaE